MALKQIACILVISTLTFAATAKADDPSPRERLERATAASSLDALTAHPWHLKLALTLFDAKGKSPADATIEFWKDGEETLRVITMGASSETELHHDGKFYRSSSGGALPDMALTVFEEFMHPGPTPDEFAGSTPDIRKQSFGKLKLDCIMLTQPLKDMSHVPLGLFPTYCLAPNADRLIATYDFGIRQVNVNGAGRFMDHDVATKFSIVEDGVVVAIASVSSLTTFTPEPDRFVPAPELVANSSATERVSSGVVAGLKTGGHNPVYPADARANHVQGTVILRAVIGRDGHIHQLRVTSAPDPLLAISALAAVRTWTYRPYLLLGRPTTVDTTIIVNYNLGP